MRSREWLRDCTFELLPLRTHDRLGDGGFARRGFLADDCLQERRGETRRCARRHDVAAVVADGDAVEGVSELGARSRLAAGRAKAAAQAIEHLASCSDAV